MTLAQDLAKLERQRREEVHTLHQTYLRTKRTIIRNVSPARIVRRNMGLSLTAAAVFGLLFAPRPTPRTSTEKAAGPAKPEASPPKRGLASSLGWIKKIIAPFAPGIADHIPDSTSPNSPSPEEHAPSKPPHAHRLLRMLLAEGASLLISRIDFSQLFHNLLHVIMPAQDHEDAHGDSRDNDPPNVSVADVGTVKPNDHENFE